MYFTEFGELNISKDKDNKINYIKLKYDDYYIILLKITM